MRGRASLQLNRDTERALRRQQTGEGRNLSTSGAAAAAGAVAPPEVDWNAS